MNEPAIRIDRLTKTYRIYGSQWARFLDMLGLARGAGEGFREHHALKNVDLAVDRGEKVAIIGRNGAGKSTLLKLISKVIRPSSGLLEVSGSVHALLGIGTGFHPDFTGRQNVISYLAHLGITGGEAEDRLREIVEFAELEEYINQPMKTYSTGMGVRLMFATSTAITPDILVVDEVLSVGDAYFSNKSFERVRSLCEEHHATFLLVTHDIYGASQLCNRFVWIENGQIYMDGRPKEVIDAYERSVKIQEEMRLRRKRLKAAHDALMAAQARRGFFAKFDRPDGRDVFAAQLTTFEGEILDRPLPVASFRLRAGNPAEDVACCRAEETAEPGASAFILDKSESNWGPAREAEGRFVRDFTSVGGIVNAAGALLAAAVPPGQDLTLEIDCQDSPAVPCEVTLFHVSGGFLHLGALGNTGSGQWLTRTFPLPATALESLRQGLADQRQAFNLRLKPKEPIGTGDVMIGSVEFIDPAGQPVQTVRTGEDLAVRFGFKVLARDFRERPIFVLTFYVRETLKIMRLMHDSTLVDGEASSSGVATFHISPHTLGAGNYQITAAIFREGYFDDPSGKFYTVNDKVLDVHNRAYELAVRSDRALDRDVLLLPLHRSSVLLNARED